MDLSRGETILRRLPPLTALRAFEAAARRLSFARAADELNVTPGAVSHHIKGLEEWLGIRLFQRANGALTLTAAGQTYLSGIAAGLDRIWDATEALAVRDSRNTLTIVLPPSFCTMWLVPRLHRFQALQPKLELRISVAAQPIDFSQHMMDVGIGFGWDVSPNLQRIPFLRYDLFAVCSPALLTGEKPIRSIDDLKHHQLIHDEGLRIHDRVDWRTFLEMSGGKEFDGISRGLHFNRASDAYEAAAQGYGIALAKSALVQGDLASGRLVKPFNITIPSEFTYDVIGMEPIINSPKVQSFCHWVQQEAMIDGMLAQPTTH